MRWERHGKAIYRTERWKAIRLEAKRRDHWKCVKCGGRNRLQVDHIVPLRATLERAFDLDNLQTLCGSCHGTKTRLEAGHPEMSPERKKWRDLLDQMRENEGTANA